MQAESLRIEEQSRVLSGNSGDYFYKLIEREGGVPFRLVFGASPGEGCYLNTGEGMNNLFGSPSGFLTEKGLFDIVHEYVPVSANLPADPAGLHYFLQHGMVDEYSIEMLVSHDTGAGKWISETGISVRDAQTGKIQGVIGVFRDITEKKQLQAFFNETRNKAEECDRMKEAFIQNISHEVRTPLNAIVGFSNLLCEPTQGYGNQKEYADIISNSTGLFLEVMDNILEISRIEAGEVKIVREPVDPVSLLRITYDTQVARAREKNLVFNCIVPEDSNITAVNSDAFKLRKIMNNLAGNAVKFTFSGKVDIGYTRRDGFIEFFVNDTGIGIRSEDQPLIFKKFFQAESGVTRRFPGTGLGLPISRAYAEMLGGWIEFSSRFGEGTSFRLMLPAR